MATTPLPPHHTHAARRQRGVGLAEVLIAVLILSVGLVGLSLLQGRVLKSTHSSMQRTEALTLLNSLMESMRANRVEAVAGLYNVAAVQAAPGGTSLAAQDIAFWFANLPRWVTTPANPSLTVACTTTNILLLRAQCDVTLQWDDSRAGGSTTETLNLASEL
ncbi:MAG: type IV pilus modification protein PilV [Betaproteobacteria bacterium]